MTEHELIEELAATVQISPDLARSTVHALADIVRRAVQTGEPLPLASFGAFCSGPCRLWAARSAADPPPADPPGQVPADDYEPSEQDIQTVIARARAHRLGLDILMSGDAHAVAAILETHAFAVEAARERVAAGAE